MEVGLWEKMDRVRIVGVQVELERALRERWDFGQKWI